MKAGCALRGISWLLPEQTVTNEDLIEDFGVWTPQKIFRKTGILERRVAEGPLSQWAVRAGEKFFAEHPQFPRESVDLLLLCGECRDYILPSTACLVHRGLGLRKNCGALSYSLGCSGYAYGLAIARSFICGGMARRVLLITGDVVTRYVNRRDKSTRPLFGDGYAASLIEASGGDYFGPMDFGTDGSGEAFIRIEAGGTALPRGPETAAEETNRFGNIRSRDDLFMDGRRVLEFALETVPESVRRVLGAAGLSLDQLDLVVFHQASLVMLNALREALAIPEEKFVIDLSHWGNTASSTIPIALARCAASGRLRPGMKVLLSGFGVGLSWSAALIRWAY